MADDIRVTPLKDVVPKIYKRRFQDALLYGFIRGQITVLNQITIEKSIFCFYKEFDINEDDYPLSACKTTYNRMMKEFYENEKKK